MQEIVDASSSTDQNRLESQFGTRFSVLSCLPYFDTIRMSTIDPMHNLFLGTSKHILKVWRDLGFLNKAALSELQSKCDEFVIPQDVGKIPSKIQSGFDGFTADEYKNWTLLFSVYSLHDVVPKRDLECFRKFVLACQYFCRQVISIRDVNVAHGLMVQFCKTFEDLYGSERVTPNIHLHCHLKECLLDYGPIYSFWLFSFERYNGLLGNVPTNKKNIEVQLMKRFCRDSIVMNWETPERFSDRFSNITKFLQDANAQRGTLNDIATNCLVSILQLSSRYIDVADQCWYTNFHISCHRKTSIHSFNNLELDYLSNAYKVMYPSIDMDDSIVSLSYVRCPELSIFGNKLGSLSSKNWRSAYINAFWFGNEGHIAERHELDLTPRPGVIKYFLKHVLVRDIVERVHWFAYCEWFKSVNVELKNKFGKPVQVWEEELVEQRGPASFIPVSRISSKCVFVKRRIGNKKVLILVPRNRYST